MQVLFLRLRVYFVAVFFLRGLASGWAEGWMGGHPLGGRPPVDFRAIITVTVNARDPPE